MGICTKRYALLAVCLLQIIFTIERQIFDFLGYLWIPILLNLFDLIFIIFGFFGAFQLRFKYILSYCSWNTLWLIWNIFLICLYLNIGVLNHQKNIVLKIDPDSSSWWEGNGPGCKKIYNTNSSIPKLENITGCVLNYVHVEVIQSSLQGFLTVVGTLLSIMLWRQFHKNPNLRQKKIIKPISLYSIEFSKNDNSRINDSDSVEYCHTDDRFQIPTSPKPMTPRRVKRRSGMARSSTSSFANYASLRTDVNGGRSVSRDGCVARLDDDDIDDDDDFGLQSKGAISGPVVTATAATAAVGSVCAKNDFGRIGNSVAASIRAHQFDRSSSPTHKSTDSVSRQSSNYRSMKSHASTRTTTTNRHKKAKLPLTNSLHLIAPAAVDSVGGCGGGSGYNQMHLNGHTNLMYQQSSVQSLNENESLEDLYTTTNNRPASLRSSYSNFHGARILSYSKTEKNVDSRLVLSFQDSQRQKNSLSRSPYPTSLQRGENGRSISSNVFFPRNQNTSSSNFNTNTISNSETNI